MNGALVKGSGRVLHDIAFHMLHRMSEFFVFVDSLPHLRGDTRTDPVFDKPNFFMISAKRCPPVTGTDTWPLCGGATLSLAP